MLVNKKELVNKHIEKYKNKTIAIAKQIWLNPEVAYEEKFASKIISNYLKSFGFKIDKIKGLPTAFVATFGKGKKKIGLLGEYDALPRLGHGCGHNLLGTGSMLAAISIAEIIKEKNLPLTISYFGCPAEESGAGKIQLVKANLFKEINYCLTWHPAAKNSITNDTWIGSQIILVEFFAKTSHSSTQTVKKNINELLVDFIYKLRKLKIPNFSYVINNSDQSLSLVPEYVSIDLAVRSFDKKEINYFISKIKLLGKKEKFRAFIKISMKEFYPITKQNLKLMDKVKTNFYDFYEASIFNSFDHKKAKEILKTVSLKEQINNMKSMNIPTNWRNKILNSEVLFSRNEMLLSFPTDVGAICNVVPTIQFQTVCMPLGVGMHTKESKDAANSSIGYKGMIYAAKILAGTILDLD